MNFDLNKLFKKDRIKLQELIEQYEVLDSDEKNIRLSDDQYEDFAAGYALDECNAFYNECIKVPWCSRCLHYQGCHSTIFGTSWGCNKDNSQCGEVEDNNWHYTNNEDIVDCEFYEFGEPNNTCVG